jgi:hypothetical protein
LEESIFKGIAIGPSASVRDGTMVKQHAQHLDVTEAGSSTESTVVFSARSVDISTSLEKHLYHCQITESGCSTECIAIFAPYGIWVSAVVKKKLYYPSINTLPRTRRQESTFATIP